MQNKRIGIILILVGVASFFLSFLFARGYDPKVGFLGSIGHMEFVLRENPVSKPFDDSEFIQEMIRLKMEKDRLEGKKSKPGEIFQMIIDDPQNKRWQEYWEGERNRIAIPYKFFLTVAIIIIFTGIGLLIVPKKQTSNECTPNG